MRLFDDMQVAHFDMELPTDAEFRTIELDVMLDQLHDAYTQRWDAAGDKTWDD